MQCCIKASSVFRCPEMTWLMQGSFHGRRSACILASSASRPWPVTEEKRTIPSGGRSQALGGGFHLGMPFALRNLVSLGQNRDDGDATVLEPDPELDIIRGWKMAGIHDVDYAPECFPLQEIGLNHGPPLRPHILRDPGKTVAWQIHKIEGPIDPEEIDHPGEPGSAAGPDQLFSLRKAVDQRGFADI